MRLDTDLIGLLTFAAGCAVLCLTIGAVIALAVTGHADAAMWVLVGGVFVGTLAIGLGSDLAVPAGPKEEKDG